MGASVVFSHAFSGELEAVSVVNEAIQNCITEGGIADDVVPVLHGDLAGYDGRSAAMAIIEDFQEVAALGSVENGQAPVVEDEELNAPERLEQAAIAPVATCQRERLEKARDAMIEHRSIVAAGFVTKGAGEPTLAQAGRTGLIMPVIRMAKQRRLSVTPFIRVRAGRFSSQAVSVIAVSRPMSGDNWMAAWR